jgi:hypothetical protein
MVEAGNKEVTVTVELFPLGQCVITRGALPAIESINVDPAVLLQRHQSGDWLEMCQHDQAENRKAIKNGSRVFSAYNLANSIRVYVITEADRSSTTILLPEEY